MPTKYFVHTAENEFEVLVTEHEDAYEVTLDGVTYRVDSQGAQNSPTRSLLIDGKSFEAATVPGRKGLDVYISGDAFQVTVTDELWARAEAAAGGAAGGHEEILSPMPGTVVKVMVEVGQSVEPGAPVVIVEAMKMQNELTAIRGGVVKEIKVEEGAVVDQDALLVVIDEPGGEG